MHPVIGISKTMKKQTIRVIFQCAVAYKYISTPCNIHITFDMPFHFKCPMSTSFDDLTYLATNSSKETHYLKPIKAKNMEKLSKVHD